MAYFASTDLELVLGADQLLALARDPDAPTTVDADLVTAVEAETRAEIQLYLDQSGITELSDVTVWPIIRTVAIDLAVYRLAARKEGRMRDEFRNSRDLAIDILTRISLGDLLPPAALQPEGGAPSSLLVEADDAVFTSTLFGKRLNNAS